MARDSWWNRRQERITLVRALAALAMGLAFLAPGFGAEGPSPSPEARSGYLDRPLPVTRDKSRAYFETGRRLFGEKRFGEALPAFQAALAERDQRYDLASQAIEALLGQKETARAKGSIKALVLLEAQASLPEFRLKELEAEAGASLTLLAELLSKENLEADFSAFIKAFLLVLDLRPLPALKDSLSALKAACSDLRSYPEAEYWIGRVYEAEGETSLAAFQYRRAWDQRASLDIYEEGFDYLGRLAALYRTQGNNRAYEDMLLKVVAEDPLYADARRFYREGMERSLGRDGFDRFFSLYRVGWGPWTPFEIELGNYYLGNGRPQALGLLAAGVDALASRCLWRLRQKDAAWEFTGLSVLLDAIARDRELQAWAEDEGFFQALHNLGLALDAGGYRQSAREIWSQLAARPYLEPWAKASSRALAAVAPKK